MERQASTQAPTITIGIPSYGDGTNLGRIFQAIARENLSDICRLEEVLVVTPTPYDGTQESIGEGRSRGLPIRLLLEPSRRGKWAAINMIRGASRSELIILINADTRFSPGSLRTIVERALSSMGSIVAARPAPDVSRGVVGVLSGLLWKIHHQTLLRQGAIHASGELMLVPRGLLPELPAGVINDDAYIAQHARRRGAGVLYEPRAVVITKPPRSIWGYLQQRRRILEGHLQLMWRFRLRGVGVVFTLLARPSSITALIKAPSRPVEMLALPLAVILEGLAMIIALLRVATGRRPLTPWPRY